jgi:hypothetical protein
MRRKFDIEKTYDRLFGGCVIRHAILESLRRNTVGKNFEWKRRRSIVRNKVFNTAIDHTCE